MITRAIALDIYGTVLASEDPENAMPVRRGFKEFVSFVRQHQIALISTSDSYITNLKIDLEIPLKRVGLDLSIFNDFFQLKTTPKNYTEVIRMYNLNSEKLFVIGDSFDKDITGAINLGCNYLHVPEYTYFATFDFSLIKIP